MPIPNLHKLLDAIKPIDPLPENPESTVLKDVKIAAVKLNDEVQKVTVSATAPHPGYGVDVSSVDFVKGKAYINYRLILPDPAALYPQVITEVKAETYVSTKYEVVLGKYEPAEPREEASVNKEPEE